MLMEAAARIRMSWNTDKNEILFEDLSKKFPPGKETDNYANNGSILP